MWRRSARHQLHASSVLTMNPELPNQGEPRLGVQVVVSRLPVPRTSSIIDFPVQSLNHCSRLGGIRTTG